MPDPMTKAEIEAAQKRHKQTDDLIPFDGLACTCGSSQRWPCDASRLATYALEVREALEETGKVNEYGVWHSHRCIFQLFRTTQEGEEPHCVVARALLGGE